MQGWPVATAYLVDAVGGEGGLEDLEVLDELVLLVRLELDLVQRHIP